MRRLHFHSEVLNRLSYSQRHGSRVGPCSVVHDRSGCAAFCPSPTLSALLHLYSVHVDDGLRSVRTQSASKYMPLKPLLTLEISVSFSTSRHLSTPVGQGIPELVPLSQHFWHHSKTSYSNDSTPSSRCGLECLEVYFVITYYGDRGSDDDDVNVKVIVPAMKHQIERTT